MADHDGAHLQRDLHMWRQTIDRRQLLAWLGGAAAALPLSACADRVGLTDEPPAADDSGLEAARRRCARTPEETAGPYPGDGSNGANALTLAGIVRSDIRTSVGPAMGTADGVVMRLGLRVVDAMCQPVAGCAVYAWHCDRDGLYSMYTLPSENYLRGVQVTDADGRVQFTTIFPGCYPGRWPHVHFEVYPTLAATSAAANRIATSQLALPRATCDAVYATAGYGPSATALARLQLSTDGAFRDGVALQTPAVRGDVFAGFDVSMRVSVRR